MRRRGKIASWKDERGFGFITPQRGRREIFVHVRSFVNRQRRPVGGEEVTYEVEVDDRGRPQARKVVFAGERAAPARPSRSGGVSSLGLLVSATFLGFLALLTAFGELPVVILGLYLAASFITFFAYGADKVAARKGRWRTQESTLHVMALVGGWPGALLAQQQFRHKYRKRPFQIVFWATVLVNCVVLGLCLTPSGAEILRSIFGSF